MTGSRNRLLTMLLMLLIGVQIGLIVGSRPAPAVASSDAAAVREMQRQTEVFRGIDRRLEKIAYEISRTKR